MKFIYFALLKSIGNMTKPRSSPRRTAATKDAGDEASIDQVLLQVARWLDRRR